MLQYDVRNAFLEFNTSMNEEELEEDELDVVLTHVELLELLTLWLLGDCELGLLIDLELELDEELDVVLTHVELLELLSDDSELKLLDCDELEVEGEEELGEEEEEELLEDEEDKEESDDELLSEDALLLELL